MWRAILVLLAAAPLALAQARAELKEPFRVFCGAGPIDVEIGHAAPLVADFDGDGVRDLLVGQFAHGRLRIYRNVGTNAKPAFTGFELFQAGGTTGTVPSG